MHPHFQHDCYKCVFLGTIVHQEHPHDLYVCTKASYNTQTGPSLIARFGDKGHEYQSLPWSSLMNTSRWDRDPILCAVMEEVLARINREAGWVLQQTMAPFLRESATQQLLCVLGREATIAMRRANTDPQWADVLGTLHWVARHSDCDCGKVVLTLEGGA